MATERRFIPGVDIQHTTIDYLVSRGPYGREPPSLMRFANFHEAGSGKTVMMWVYKGSRYSAAQRFSAAI